jgi:hypothetical protein
MSEHGEWENKVMDRKTGSEWVMKAKERVLEWRVVLRAVLKAVNTACRCWMLLGVDMVVGYGSRIYIYKRRGGCDWV